MLFSFSVQDTKILPLDEVNLNALDKRLLKTSSKSWLSVFTKIFSSNSNTILNELSLQGEPFVGKAGKLMNMAFDAIGLKREEVYIANIVKCRPPSNRNPEDDEAIACLNYLRNQVILVKPMSYMNLSGNAVRMFVDYYKIDSNVLYHNNFEYFLSPS